MRANIELIHGDCLEGMREMGGGSIDAIITDPPYLYLKNQRLEREFDEQLFFRECKRLLKKDGLIVLFGRGTSFYRWNTILAEAGMKFKEEIIWNKSYNSSPAQAISRVHETISIHAKGKGKINKVKIPYTEQAADLRSIAVDIKRIKSALGNRKELDDLLTYLRSGGRFGHKTFTGNENPATMNNVRMGRKATGIMFAIREGMREKSIIRLVRDHYSVIHNTQKPIRLFERLIALVTKPGDSILDPFMGKGSTGMAAVIMKRRFIGIELDPKHFHDAEKKLAYEQSQIKMF